MAYLVITLNGTQIGRHELRGEAVIGRATDCEVWVNDNGISRRHAKIELRPDGRWFVFDLKSKNGVYLRDVQVFDQILTDGDVLKVGPARIMFHEVGTYNARPDDPHDVLGEQLLAELESGKPSEAQPVPENTGRRPLPKPAATVAKPPEPIYITAEELKVAEGGSTSASDGPRSLAFQRPPARPIVDKPDDE